MTRFSHTNFFTGSLEKCDPALGRIVAQEGQRQQDRIELIASENIVSQATLDALGSIFTNKTVEGYPSKRFHGGAEIVDQAENLAIERARQLFGCEYVNVQPHSGTQANQAVFFACLQPGDTVLSMSLSAGGHLSHGAKPNQSGRWFNALHYGVHLETGQLDYDMIGTQAIEAKPKLLIAGGSAYPRSINFSRMREIADQVGALFLVDMAHFAGLVAAGVHHNPMDYADIVTCTTTKTMRGARGGLIMCNAEGLAKKINSSVFPGVQGSVHLQVVLAKAVCLGEALRPEFRTYGKQVVVNARALVDCLKEGGHKIVSDGTDTHLILLDVGGLGMTGDQAERLLAEAHITSNKNPIPNDAVRPMDWVGLRLGTAAATTRGFDEDDFRLLGRLINDILATKDTDVAERELTLSRAREVVAGLCAKYPIYGH